MDQEKYLKTGNDRAQELYLAINTKGVVAVCDNYVSALSSAGIGTPDFSVIKRIANINQANDLTRAFFHAVSAVQLCPPRAFDTWEKIDSRGLKPLITKINTATIYRPLEITTVDVNAAAVDDVRKLI